MMYISHVELTNIRCIEHVVLDLESKAPTNKSLVLLGDNGVGKSTILRSIAIGLCDRAGAGALLSDLYGDLIREGAKKGSIIITLKKGRKEYCIKTFVTKSDAGLEEIRKEPKDFAWEKVFVCGYGANRAMHGNNAYDEYSIADAVYTLFNYEWPLWSPELVIHRRLRKAKNPDEEERMICNQLADILMLKHGAVALTDNGLTVKSNGNHGFPIGALADGHESTLTWVFDLMGWTYLAHRKLSSPNGIVLIDEIEQHLHPLWQRHIFHLLAEQFPKVQFIATTHSALCAAGTADLEERKCQMEVLVREDDGTVHNNSISPMTGWRYDQVLTSAAFGLPLARGISVETLIKEIRALYRKTKLTVLERTDLQRLFRQLEEKSSRAYEDEFARKEYHDVGRTLSELKATLDQGQTHP